MIRRCCVALLGRLTNRFFGGKSIEAGNLFSVSDPIVCGTAGSD